MASRGGRKAPAPSANHNASDKAKGPAAGAGAAPAPAAPSPPNSNGVVAGGAGGGTGTGSGGAQSPPAPQVQIIDVWADNFRAELEKIMDIIDDYPYIAMDTEFPGVLMRPLRSYPDLATANYHTLKCNVDLLKLIQLGLCFTDDRGQLPPGNPVWQFNFSFNLAEDFSAPDSIELLKAAGIDFKRHASEGVDVMEFAELLMTSGVVLNPDTHWLSFHSGYDYAYFLRMMTCLSLPQEPKKFFDLLSCYFPHIYDVKQLLKFAGQAAAKSAAAAAAASSGGSSKKSSSPDGGPESAGSPAAAAAAAAAGDAEADKAGTGAGGAADPAEAGEAGASAGADPGVHVNLPGGAGGETAGRAYLHHHMGLQAIADELGLRRVGVQHQAGSDALLTARVFFALRDQLFQGRIDPGFVNSVYGLENPLLLLVRS